MYCDKDALLVKGNDLSHIKPKTNYNKEIMGQSGGFGFESREYPFNYEPLSNAETFHSSCLQ